MREECRGRGRFCNGGSVIDHGFPIGAYTIEMYIHVYDNEMIFLRQHGVLEPFRVQRGVTAKRKHVIK